MPTAKPRIFLTMDPVPFRYLQQIAKKQEHSLARTAAELIQAGMEAMEDEWLSELADQRLDGFDEKQAISFQEVKKHFALKSRGKSR